MVDPVISAEEARSRGLRLYFTGFPCKKGHIAPRTVGKRSCVECDREAKAISYRKNRSAHKERGRAWVERNREKVRSTNAKWNKSNPDVCRQAYKKWAAGKPERVKELSRQSRVKHQRRIADYMKAYVSANPDKYRAYNSRRRALRRASKFLGCQYTDGDIREIFQAQKGKCGYCKRKLGEDYHADHIAPLSRGGSNDRRNIQLLCEPCNLSKGARDPIEHARRNGLLL